MSNTDTGSSSSEELEAGVPNSYTITKQDVVFQTDPTEADCSHNFPDINLPVPSDDLQQNSNNNTSPLVEKLKLLNCLEALKFDPTIEKSPTGKSGASSSDKINKNSPTTAMGPASLRTSPNTKSKVLGFDQTFDKAGAWFSSQPELRKESEKAERNPPGYATIIKQWGKRPLLVESEAPWTRRNKMYMNALKALEKAKQNANPSPSTVNQINNNNNNQAKGSAKPSPSSRSSGLQPMMFTNPPGMFQNNPPGIFQNNPPGIFQNNPPGMFQILSQQGGAIPQVSILPPQGNNNNVPIVSGISPFPPNINLMNPTRPLAVALESPFPYQEIVLPVQPPPPPTMMFGHLNSQGLWMPLIQQIHQLQHMQQQYQNQQFQPSQFQNQQGPVQHQQQHQQQQQGQTQPPYYYQQFKPEDPR